MLRTFGGGNIVRNIQWDVIVLLWVFRDRDRPDAKHNAQYDKSIYSSVYTAAIEFLSVIHLAIATIIELSPGHPVGVIGSIGLIQYIYRQTT